MTYTNDVYLVVVKNHLELVKVEPPICLPAAQILCI